MVELGQGVRSRIDLRISLLKEVEVEKGRMMQKINLQILRSKLAYVLL